MIFLLLFIFGAIIGSFLNVVILRLPEGKVLSGRSNCMSCGHILQPQDLVPVASFIFLGGRCRYCGKKISPRYAIIETITGLLFLLAGACFYPSNAASWIVLIRVMFALAVLVPVFVIDLEHYLILDKVVGFGMAGIVVLNLILDWVNKNFFPHGYFVIGLEGAAAVTVIFFALWFFSKGRWLGFGDVKFAPLFGLILGWPLVLVGLFIAIILGGLVGTALLISGKSSLKSRLPFGTFLSLGAFFALFWGSSLLYWYLAVLGF